MSIFLFVFLLIPIPLIVAFLSFRIAIFKFYSEPLYVPTRQT